MLNVYRKHGIWNRVNMDNFWSTVISNIKKEKTVNLKKILLMWEKKNPNVLISQNEIFDHRFKLSCWKSSGTPWKIPSPPCGSGCPPHPKKNLKSTSPTLFKSASKFLAPPLQKGGGGRILWVYIDILIIDILSWVEIGERGFWSWNIYQKYQGYWSQVLIHSIIFETFTFLVSVCNNLPSSMLKCEVSLT